MISGISLKTSSRVASIVLLSGLMSAVLIGRPSGATQDGYGVASHDAWHNPSLIEGRAVKIARLEQGE